MMRFSSLIIVIALTLLLISCGDSNSSNNSPTKGVSIDMSLYESRSIPGSEWVHVERNHPSGDIFEDGFVYNGQKVGTWTSYYPDDGYIQNISNYHNGVLMGPFLEFDERGRLNKHYTYENNLLSGQFASFKNGRLTNKVEYLNGKLNGFSREYNTKSVLIKEAHYKDDVLDGEVNSYNDEGKLVLQYIYKNGDKVSGGIVE